ncbi:MAG: tRNA (N6-threonylcarbamoyladenosine(37)-N6)-methyltransferase TrmO [Phycisphaerae bacterium]|nr:tRNA (N6-threonylcarbamoyladenosine(37)-N6)-methyltransferase TrmO [Phycisphaerae bacterium]
MKDSEFAFHSIGVIHSPHKEVSQIPIQPVFCSDIEGTVLLNNKYVDGLKDLQGFSHIHLFYYFDHSQKTCLRLKPYLSDQERGIFATRAPHRPNKLGMSLVRLDRIEGNILYVRDLDILDGTPLLDIKPYIQRFDSRENVKSGWQDTILDDVASVRGLRDFKIQKGKS